MPPLESRSWEEDFDLRYTEGYTDTLGTFFPNQRSLDLKAFISIVAQEEYIKTRKRVGDWVDMMFKYDEFARQWSGEDEAVASIMSYIDGNHEKNT